MCDWIERCCNVLAALIVLSLLVWVGWYILHVKVLDKI